MQGDRRKKADNREHWARPAAEFFVAGYKVWPTQPYPARSPMQTGKASARNPGWVWGLGQSMARHAFRVMAKFESRTLETQTNILSLNSQRAINCENERRYKDYRASTPSF